MAQTKIEWTWRRHPRTGHTHPGFTYNPWIGCTKISPACGLCYAASTDDRRFSKIPAMGGSLEHPLSHWGKGAPRHQTVSTKKDPPKWNRLAERAGLALAVFCGSLCDWADEEVPDSWRDDLMELVLATPNLEWLFLTKRTENARRYFANKTVPPNVRMGATLENQDCFDSRIADLLAIQAPLGHFASMEPLFGPVDLTKALKPDPVLDHAGKGEALARTIGWVIVGGESCWDDKSKSHSMHPDDALMVASQAWAAGIPFTFKQWGDWCPAYEIPDPQAQAMCALGKVPHRDLGRGDQGRRLSFNVGKAIAGRQLEGQLWEEHPPVRLLS